MTLRSQTLREEIANSLSHGAALLAVIAAVPFLLGASSHVNNVNLAGMLIFAVTMVFLYFTSTLYHALPEGRAKSVFLKLSDRT